MRSWSKFGWRVCGVASHVEAVRVASGAVDKTAEYWIPVLLSKSSEFKRKDPQWSVDDISAELLCWLSTQTKQPYNLLLDAKYLDPSQDTPVENLHTYLLGHKKYAWYDMHSSWDDSTQALFAIRLQSTDTNGLTILPISICLYDAVPKRFNQQTLQNAHANCRALGELGAALWIAEIDDLEQYLEDLEVWIDNVLDAWARIDPAKILKKIKLHLLKHLPAHIRRFGPSCFNAVFRMCSVLSNHQAPSRDIALKNGELGRLTHIISGGYWHAYSATASRMDTASPNEAQDLPKDVCPVGSWVIDRHFIARIIEILHSSKGNQTLDLVTLHEFTLSEALHHYYEMPVLHKPERHHLVVNSETIQFIINVQHDCQAAGCSATGSTRQRQERMESGQELSCIEHVADDEQYIINTHALHNAARLRCYLPRYLTVPQPLIMNRKEWHVEIAVGLRVTQSAKRTQTQEKAAVT
ncbi:hypothetical protein BT96DRAFT_1002502 [Gymnopus androsaceus JB14]|uniref:Uncharacterized protein n=1 Tax=Gymnopus androsaceus JB14 TaxID=1447944 RepID=A0A6A4GXU8_9AGAR|nr:hypothetical protein BT96DRAFT_1002502 [Gymnopus androsaceus JB14]